MLGERGTWGNVKKNKWKQTKVQVSQPVSQSAPVARENINVRYDVYHRIKTEIPAWYLDPPLFSFSDKV